MILIKGVSISLVDPVLNVFNIVFILFSADGRDLHSSEPLQTWNFVLYLSIEQRERIYLPTCKHYHQLKINIKYVEYIEHRVNKADMYSLKS